MVNQLTETWTLKQGVNVFKIHGLLCSIDKQKKVNYRFLLNKF